MNANQPGLNKRAPRFQRAMIRWFLKNHSQFLVPVALKKINAKKVAIVFSEHPDSLCVSFGSSGLSVHAMWDGCSWDRLLDLDVLPQATRRGYQCKLCMGWPKSATGPVACFPTREALYQDHVFEPFLKWVNETLACASQMSLYGDPEDCTWAELIDAADDSLERESLRVSIPFPNAHRWRPQDSAFSPMSKLNGRAKAKRVEELMERLLTLPASR